MQQFTSRWPGIEKGIIPLSVNESVGGLRECLRLMPINGSLVTYKRPKNPLGVSLEFPFPQLHLGSFPLLLWENRVERLDWNFEPTGVFLATPVGLRWHIADFGRYILATNGACVVEVSSAGALDFRNDLPKFSTVCNFRGQVVCGGFFEPYQGFGRSGVAWSKIGRLDFTIDKSNTAGMMSFGHDEEVFGLVELGDSVLVLTNKAVHRLMPVSEPVVGFSLMTHDIPGVAGRGAFCSTKERCVLLDQHGSLWSVGLLNRYGESIKRISGPEFFGHLRGFDPILTYDAENNAIDIGTPQVAYKVLPDGVCQTPFAVSSQTTHFTQTIGTFGLISSQQGFYLRTRPYSFGINGLKTLTMVQLQGDFSGPVFVQVEWRNSRLEKMRQTPPVRVNNQGFCFPRVTGEELALIITGPEERCTKIDAIGVSYQLCDGRIRRGIMNVDSPDTGTGGQ